MFFTIFYISHDKKITKPKSKLRDTLPCMIMISTSVKKMVNELLIVN